ncbi:lytic transglycosylase domain-containing protein [Mesorhizobium sp. CO1-1-8]|uniref:lytic transglycosylase domain-containing protein n=1 Tax=Mesorhizobium sp. CO1-1-8 TaxID=2876631 RepID=UPI001CD12EB7|nr:lytic transglycosylase domain-containing protein [Mesorhizobium sp. CO1-1-8]MBZ9772608.1 lytic transglycosylase domain-containing protein [Mesorhizobium sp. CO1-1-8]
MAKRLARQSLLAIAILNCTASWAGSSTEKTIILPPMAATGSKLVAQEIGSVFRDRWRGEGRAFVVGPEGRAQPTNDSFGVVNWGMGIADQRPFGEQSQVDLKNRPTQAPCGPSPATATEVAQMIVDAAHRHGVAPRFALAIATAESGLDRDRNSGKGARGAMQLMPATADFLGVTDVCDPAQNIDGGVRLLRSLLDTYRNPLVVAAAYNAGEANVHKYGGIPPFPETVRFVSEVINRQLGLPAPVTRGIRPKATTSQSTDDNPTSAAPSSGKSRQWVGGVMQF